MTCASFNAWILVALLLAACGKERPADDPETAALKEIKRAIEAEIDERGRSETDARSVPLGRSVTVGAAKVAFTRVVQQPAPGSDDPEEFLFLHYEVTNVSETTVLEAGRRGQLIGFPTVRDEFGNEVANAFGDGTMPPQKLGPGERFASFHQTRLPPVAKAGQFAAEGHVAVDNQGSTQPLRLVFERDAIEQAKAPDISGWWTGTRARHSGDAEVAFAMEVTQAGESVDARLLTHMQTRQGSGWTRETLRGRVTRSGVVDFGDWGKAPLKGEAMSGYSNHGRFQMRRAAGSHPVVAEAVRVRTRQDALDLSGRWELWMPESDAWAVEIDLRQQGEALAGTAVGSDGHTERVPLAVLGRLSLETMDLTLTGPGGDRKVQVEAWVRAADGQPPRFEPRGGALKWELAPARTRKVPFWNLRWNHEQARRLRSQRKPIEAIALLKPAYAECRGHMLGWWIGLTGALCHADAGRLAEALGWIKVSMDDYWTAMTEQEQSSFLRELREDQGWSGLRKDVWTGSRLDALARDYEPFVGKPLRPRSPEEAAKVAAQRATLFGWLGSGKEYDGKRIRKDKAEPFTIQFELDERTGAVAGLMSWPGLGSQHRIRGGVVENSTACRVVFEETEAVRHGQADLGIRYGLAPTEDGNLSGRFVAAQMLFDRHEGTVTVSGAGRDAPVRPTVEAIDVVWHRLTWRLTGHPAEWTLGTPGGAATVALAPGADGVTFSGTLPAGPAGTAQWCAVSYTGEPPLRAGALEEFVVEGTLPEQCPFGFCVGVVAGSGAPENRLEIRRNPQTGHAELRLPGAELEVFRPTKGEQFVDLDRVPWQGGAFALRIRIEDRDKGLVSVHLNGVSVLKQQFDVAHQGCSVLGQARKSHAVVLMVWMEGPAGARIPDGIRLRKFAITRGR